MSLLFRRSPYIVIGLTTVFATVLSCTKLDYKYVASAYFVILFILMWMYRNPNRRPTDKSYIYSPSDGKVMNVTEDDDYYTVRTFLSPLDVHVQYTPYDGIISSIKHTPGAFNLAYLEKAKENERLTTTIKTDIGDIQVIQIAGLIFRRAINFHNPGDKIKLGQQLGMIKFSSRVDTIIPKKGVHMLVKKGDILQGGLTKMAKITGSNR